MNSGISLLVQTEFFNDVIITIGVGAGGIGGIGPPTFRTGGDPPLFFRRVCNVLMVYYIRPSSSNCLSMQYDGTSGCSCNARFIKQTCAVREIPRD